MRKFSDLSDLDKGVAIVREEITKKISYYHKKMNAINSKREDDISEIDETNLDYFRILVHGLNVSINICNDMLDISTLGEIDMIGWEKIKTD